MRIAIVNWTRRKVGGIETYLSTVIPELPSAGHEVAFWHEVDAPAEREQILLPQGAPSWCAAELGAERSLDALREWQPDVIYSHKVEDPGLEAEILRVAPSVYFAHDYQGMCISGTKTFKFPEIKPCGRSFDRRCLAHYFPHRCGGLSPLTMLKLYRLQSQRRELLHRYWAIVTHSDHMLRELNEHGLVATNVYKHAAETGGRSNAYDCSFPNDSATKDSEPGMDEHSPWRLLLSGRMEMLKGGHVFLDALPKVIAELRKPLRVTFAGDGRARTDLERQATRLQEQHEGLEFYFAGWTPPSRMSDMLDDCDLLVVPSLWPEPFGLVGPEAGLKGVPVAAFAVGGIADWLADGINGYLAPGDRPTSEGLADAIIHCLRDPMVHARLRRGALRIAKRFNIKNHLTTLLEVFENVVRREELPDSMALNPKTRVG